MINKKALISIKTILVILLIVVLLIFLFKGFASTSSITPTAIRSTTTTISSDSPNEITYDFCFTADAGSQFSDCNVYDSEDFGFSVPSTQTQSTLPEFVDGIEPQSNIKTTDVIFYNLRGTAGLCSDRERSITPIIENEEAVCRIDRGVTIEDKTRAVISCTFRGTAISNEGSAKFWGLTGGCAKITIQKEGAEAPQSVNGDDDEIIPDIVEGCIQNIDCIDSCSSDEMPTCSEGSCYCDDVPAKTQPMTELSWIYKFNLWVDKWVNKFLDLFR